MSDHEVRAAIIAAAGELADALESADRALAKLAPLLTPLPVEQVAIDDNDGVLRLLRRVAERQESKVDA